jgi:hypothetical protein
MCLPLAVPRDNFRGDTYLTTLTLTVNLTLFTVVIFSERYILLNRFQPTERNSHLPGDVTISRRLVWVVLCVEACRIPVTVLMLTAVAVPGVSIPREMNAAVSTTLSPLSAALVPVVYVYRAYAEQRQRVRKARLHQRLEAFLHESEMTDLHCTEAATVTE